MTSFRNSFWIAFALIGAISLLPFAVTSAVDSRGLAPKPAFPLPGRQFVAEYGGQGAYVAHLAYWWNLFGIGNEIRRADVVLLGSSHTQFGLSARQLSDAFSRSLARPIKVFNAGLGCDTPLSFDASLLGRLDIRNRPVVADTFAYDYDPYTYACFSEFSGVTDRVQAYFKALAIWSRFDLDWMLDGYLPRVDLRGGRVTVARYLNEPATILDWRYGDVAVLFRPDIGEEFPASASQTAENLASGPAWDLASGTLPLPDTFGAIVAQNRVRPIFTMVPYMTSSAFDRDRYDNVEKLLAAPAGGTRAPFIGIPIAGLMSFDGEHLTGNARARATQWVALSMEEFGLLSPALRR